jgi:curli biogenesis system outer membrane secretion channel CsgG
MLAAALAALSATLPAQTAWAQDGKKNGDKKGKDQKEEIVPALPAYFGPKKRLSVADLEIKVNTTITTTATPSSATTTSSLNIEAPPPTDFGTGMTEMLTTALVNSNRFVMLERKALKDIQDEQALGKTETVQKDAAATEGGLLGSQAIIRGAITEFTYKRSATSSGGILGKVLDAGKSGTEAMVALDIRIYDSVTGVIIDSVRAEGRAKATSQGFNFNLGDIKLGSSSFNATPLGQATRQAIEKAVAFICERMEKKAAGSREGLKVGDEFEVLKPGKAIIHPQTKVVLGRGQDKLIGKCKITTIMDDFAIAVPTEGAGFSKDDVVRMIFKPQTAPVAPATPAAP